MSLGLLGSAVSGLVTGGRAAAGGCRVPVGRIARLSTMGGLGPAFVAARSASNSSTVLYLPGRAEMRDGGKGTAMGKNFALKFYVHAYLNEKPTCLS